MDRVGSVHFQIVPSSGLYFSLSVGPFQSSWCQLQDFKRVLHLSLPKTFPLFILASSVCRSLQCLISALTRGGEGHLFSRAVGREEHCRQISLVSVVSAPGVSATLGLPCSRRVCFPSLHCSGSRLLCRGII